MTTLDPKALDPELAQQIEAEVERRVAERVAGLEARLARLEDRDRGQKVTLLVHSGDMDRLMAAFMVATGGVAMGREVSMFFTFWGLTALKKRTTLRGKSLTERALAIALPRGSGKAGTSRMNFLGAGPALFEHLMRKHNVKTLAELIDLAQELGVRLVACTTSMGLMGITREELLDPVDVGGVATYLGDALDSGVTLVF